MIFLPFWTSKISKISIQLLFFKDNVNKSIVFLKIWAHVRVLEVISAGNCTGTQSGSNETTPEVQNTDFLSKNIKIMAGLGKLFF